jgi:hypothetical protein
MINKIVKKSLPPQPSSIQTLVPSLKISSILGGVISSSIEAPQVASSVPMLVSRLCISAGLSSLFVPSLLVTDPPQNDRSIRLNLTDESGSK